MMAFFRFGPSLSYHYMTPLKEAKTHRRARRVRRDFIRSSPWPSGRTGCALSVLRGEKTLIPGESLYEALSFQERYGIIDASR